MSSYLEKLKKGMGLEETEEEIKLASEEDVIDIEDGISIEDDEDIEDNEDNVELVSEEIKELEEVEPVEKPKKKPKKKTNKKKTSKKEEDVFTEVSFGDPLALEKEKEVSLSALKKDRWLKPEGELTVDVYQTDKNIIIRSAIAGVKMTDINIVLEGDVLTIKGQRDLPKDSEEIKDSFCQECHWGLFSRSIILPVTIDEENIEATMKNGILELRMRIINRVGQKEIKVKKA